MSEQMNDNLTTEEIMQTLQLIYPETKQLSSEFIGVKNQDTRGIYCIKTGNILSNESGYMGALVRDKYAIISSRVPYLSKGQISLFDPEIYLVEPDKKLRFEFNKPIFLIEVPLSDYRIIIILKDNTYHVIDTITGETLGEFKNCDIQNHFNSDNISGIVCTISDGLNIYGISKSGELKTVKELMSKFNPTLVKRGSKTYYKFKDADENEITLNELGQRYSA